MIVIFHGWLTSDTQHGVRMSGYLVSGLIYGVHQ